MERNCFVPKEECRSGRTRRGWNFPYVMSPSRSFPSDIVLDANDRSESYGRYGTRR